jgi:ribosomal protein S3
LGQKTHPYGFRLGYNKGWKSRWFAKKEYADLLHEDVILRKQLKDRLKSAGISGIDIERAANKLVVRIYTARPGIIIGRKGSEIDKLKGEVQKRTKREVHIDIQEVHRPELDATLVAESIALQLEKRVAFRRGAYDLRADRREVLGLSRRKSAGARKSSCRRGEIGSIRKRARHHVDAEKSEVPQAAARTPPGQSLAG